MHWGHHRAWGHREGTLQSQRCSLVQGAMEEQQGRQHRELSRGLHKLEGAVDDLRGAVEDKVGWLPETVTCCNNDEDLDKRVTHKDRHRWPWH